eukprot:ctg_4205.g498
MCPGGAAGRNLVFCSVQAARAQLRISVVTLRSGALLKYAAFCRFDRCRGHGLADGGEFSAARAPTPAVRRGGETIPAPAGSGDGPQHRSSVPNAPPAGRLSGCPGIGRRGRRRTGHPDLHGGRAVLRAGPGDSPAAVHGQERVALRRGARQRRHRQDMQQHGARHPDALHLRSAVVRAATGHATRQAVGGAERLVGALLEQRHLQPGTGRREGRARGERLRGRLRVRPDAQRSRPGAARCRPRPNLRAHGRARRRAVQPHGDARRAREKFCCISCRDKSSVRACVRAADRDRVGVTARPRFVVALCSRVGVNGRRSAAKAGWRGGRVLSAERAAEEEGTARPQLPSPSRECLATRRYSDFRRSRTLSPARSAHEPLQRQTKGRRRHRLAAAAVPPGEAPGCRRDRRIRGAQAAVVPAVVHPSHRQRGRGGRLAVVSVAPGLGRSGHLCGAALVVRVPGALPELRAGAHALAARGARE